MHKCYLYVNNVTLINIFLLVHHRINYISKSDQNLSIKFRGLICGKPETEGQVNLILEGNMQQQHEGDDVSGGYCGVRG